MSNPEYPFGRDGRLPKTRGDASPDASANQMPPGRRSSSSGIQPRYHHISRSAESTSLSPGTMPSVVSAQEPLSLDPAAAYSTNPYPRQRYSTVPGAESTAPSISYPVPDPRTIEAPWPAEFDRSVSIPQYQTSDWPDPGRSHHNRPSLTGYNMPPSANSEYASSTQLSPDFSPENRFATLQPPQHSSTFPMYGPVGTASSLYFPPNPRQPQPLARSSTLPAPSSPPAAHSEAHREQVIRNITRAQSGTADHGGRRSSAATPPFPYPTSTPGPFEPSPTLSTSASTPASASASGSAEAATDTAHQRPRCWEHGCNGKEFSTFSNLLRHQREKAGATQKSTCPNCGAEFTRTTARNAHLRSGKCKPAGAPSSSSG